MEHSENVWYPNTSPMWGNANVMVGSTATPMYDGYYFWYWYPGRDYCVWFDTPISIENLDNSNVCYRLQGNVWFCPTTPVEELPPAVVPLPGNVKPVISVTSVKMENSPEHVAVMFGQVLNNLK